MCSLVVEDSSLGIQYRVNVGQRGYRNDEASAGCYGNVVCVAKLVR